MWALERAVAKFLLLAGTATGIVGAASPAGAAEIVPGGALDINLSGQFRTGVVFGENDSIGDNDPGYGFYTNNRLSLDIRGKDDGTLIEYGGRIRFRLDNGRGSDNDLIDRSWLFVRGGVGRNPIRE